MKKIFAFLLVALCCTVTYSQEFNTEKLDGLLQNIEDADRGMLSLSIYQDGKPIYTKAVGYADYESNQKANPKTMYRVGSISKSFTAAVILKLIEENKLELETTLGEFFPDLPNADKITVKQLLNHHSGLYNFTNMEDYLDWMEEERSKEELLKLMSTKGSVFEPGEKGEYSNTNYVLLTWIAEKAGERNFSQMLEEYIIEPLNLQRTRYQGQINPQNNEAYSYESAKPWKKTTETHMSIPLGAGAIVSTPSDLNEFYIGLFNNKIISEESLELMTTMEDNFGLGLFQFPFNDRKAYGHTGGIDGFSSMSGYFPESKLAISATANALNISLNDVMIGALSIYYDQPYELPHYKKLIATDRKTLKQYEGLYKSDNFQLDIKVFIEDEKLMAQATGQSAFPLTAVGKDEFEFSQAKIQMKFMPKENTMKFTQNGFSAVMKKE